MHQAGPAEIYLLPGLHGTGRLFAPLRQALSRATHDDPISLSTSGVEYPPDRALGYGELVSLVREGAPTQPYVLVAESFSGPLALQLAADRPKLLRGIVLVASFARSPALRGTAPLISALSALAFALPPFSMAIRTLLTGIHAPADLVDAVARAMRSVEPHVLRHRLRQVLSVDVRPCLQAIDVPVLYLRARHDRVVGRRALRPLRSGIAQFEVRELAGPHLLLQSRPVESADTLSKFVRACGRSKGTAPASTPR